MMEIIENGESVGKIEIVNNSFSWTYTGDRIEVSAMLGRVDNLTIEKHDGPSDPTTGESPTFTVEALPENKFSKAMVLLQMTDGIELEE